MDPATHLRHRLLIVDDEEAVLFAMMDYFGRSGFQVDCARTRTEAEGLLTTGTYSLLIADLRLAPTDPWGGLALLRQALQGCRARRGILLTAYGSAEVEAELLALGGAVLLSKPRPLVQVAEAVGRLLAVPPVL